MTRLVSFLVFAGVLSAQTFTANITGVVTDPDGAVIPGATIVLTSGATREVRTATTNETGRYRFSQIPPSGYTLKISMQGFKEYVSAGIELATNQSLEVNAVLALGPVAETVEVTAAPPLLQTQNATQSVSLDSKAFEELPINTRNPFVLMHSTAGVVAVRTGISQSVGDEDHGRFAVNGGRDETVLILIDGVPAVAADWGALVAAPGVDSVNEMQIVRNTYDAQFGRSGGGVVNMTTKGGTQRYHGTIFEFFRDDALDANGFFSNMYGTAKPSFSRNQFGGNAGGPLWKRRRLFGFFGFESLHQGTPSGGVTTVPSELERSGDFTQTFNRDRSPVIIYDPLTTRLDATGKAYTRSPFAGNRIPANRFDPVGAAVLKSWMPLPNRPGDPYTQINNYAKSETSIVINDRYDVRGDWARSEKHTLFARVTRVLNDYRPPALFENPAAATGPTGGGQRLQMSIGNTFILSPTLVVNALAGGANWVQPEYTRAPNFDATTLGWPKEVARQFAPVPPQFGISDYTGLGYRYAINNRRHILNAQVNVSKELASHSVKFGFAWENFQFSRQAQTAPAFSFNRYFTSGPDPDRRISTAGNTIASLLLGIGSGSADNAAEPFLSQPSYAWYMQDNWNVTRRLTLTAGIRHEIQNGRHERFNRLNYFDYDAVNPIGAKVGLPNLKGGLRFLDDTRLYPWPAPMDNLAPRIGLAYKVTDRLVVRSGYGIFYFRATAARTASNSMQGYSMSTPWVGSIDGRTPTDYLSNPFPGGILQPTGNAAGLLTQIGLGVQAYQGTHPTPYMQQYSLDLQYAIGREMAIELGYVGNQGRKLHYGFDFERNQLPEAALALGPALLDMVPNPFYGQIQTGTLAARTVQRGQLLRPYPQFTGVAVLDVVGASSSYNAFEAKFRRRLAAGLNVTASYQWSKALDNASEDQAWEISDRPRSFYNLRQERSISAHDVPHDAAVTFMYALPFGKGRTWGANLPAAAEAIAGGWQVNGIFKWGFGLPLMFSATNNTYSMGGSQFPNVTSLKDAAAGDRTIDRWFNPAAFSQPANFTFGNTPRWVGAIRAGSTNNWDLSVSKSFRIRERYRAQVRGDFFNAFNRVQFGRANTNVASAGFGQVRGTMNTGPRQIQIGARFSF